MLDEDLPVQIDRLQPDVVVLMTTIDDVLDRVWDDAEGELSAEDERFQTRLHQAYRDATASIVAQGVPSVVWMVPPVPVNSSSAVELNDPATFEAQHDDHPPRRRGVRTGDVSDRVRPLDGRRAATTPTRRGGPTART